MTSIEEASHWLASLQSKQRARFLVRLAHELTIVGRVLFHSSAPEINRLEQLRQLNEIQHRVMGYVLHALDTDEDPKWIPPVLSYIFECESPELREHSIQAWTDTVGHFDRR